MFHLTRISDVDQVLVAGQHQVLAALRAEVHRPECSPRRLSSRARSAKAVSCSTPGPRVAAVSPESSVTTPRWEGEIQCVLVKTSHNRTKHQRSPTATSEPIGRPGRPPPSPPPPPPKRARLRRSKSSIARDVAYPQPGVAAHARGGSPHGPPACASSDGGSPPPRFRFAPHGPLLSANRPRTRPPHPEMIVIAAEYRGHAARKTVAS